jgi:hypothetical protein
MTVRELIELNQMITDIEITIRKNGSALLDQLNMGPAEGIKPPFPTMVPKEERYIGNIGIDTKREAYYIDKSINAWDDGKDYWQVKPNRIPNKWLDLEVYAWEVWPASTVVPGSNRRNDWGHSFKNINFHGQRINITALPSGEHLEIKEPKPEQKPTDDIEGQLNIMDMIGGTEE